MTEHDTSSRSQEERQLVRSLAFLFVCFYLGTRLTQSYGEGVADVLSINWELGRTIIVILLSSLSGIVTLVLWAAAMSLVRKLKGNAGV